MRRSSLPVNPQEDEHNGWFSPAETSSVSTHTFTPASGLRGVLRITKMLWDSIRQTSMLRHRRAYQTGQYLPGFLPRLALSNKLGNNSRCGNWRLRQKCPQYSVTTSLCLAYMITSILWSTDSPSKTSKTLSSPFAKTPATFVLPDLDRHSIITLRPFKPSAFTTPRPTSTVSTTSELRFTSVVSRSGAAAEIAPRTLLTSPSRLCPVTPKSFSGHPQPHILNYHFHTFWAAS